MQWINWSEKEKKNMLVTWFDSFISNSNTSTYWVLFLTVTLVLTEYLPFSLLVFRGLYAMDELLLSVGTETDVIIKVITDTVRKRVTDTW